MYSPLKLLEFRDYDIRLIINSVINIAGKIWTMNNEEMSKPYRDPNPNPDPSFQRLIFTEVHSPDTGKMYLENGESCRYPDNSDPSIEIVKFARVRSPNETGISNGRGWTATISITQTVTL